MRSQLRKIRADEEALTTVEYAVLLALVVVAAIAVWTTFGSIVRTKVANSGNSLNAI